MKKDKCGTIVSPSRKAPYGYGLCSACNHPNVHLNHRGQIGEHGSVELGGRCPGSLSAPANVGGNNIYLLLTQQSANLARPIWQERFCFLAPSLREATNSVLRWMRYHGMHYDPEDILVRLVPPGQANSEDLHNDWIPLP